QEKKAPILPKAGTGSAGSRNPEPDPRDTGTCCCRNRVRPGILMNPGWGQDAPRVQSPEDIPQKPAQQGYPRPRYSDALPYRDGFPCTTRYPAGCGIRPRYRETGMRIVRVERHRNSRPRPNQDPIRRPSPAGGNTPGGAAVQPSGTPAHGYF